MYSKEELEEIVENQRAYFNQGETLEVSFRIQQLKKLKKAVLDYEIPFEEALKEDLGRSPVEAYLCDIGPILVEINEIIRGLKRWARPETHFSGLLCFPSLTTKVYKVPYGVTLIISPFNFPLLLTIGVLAASICGGNTAVIKTSSKSRACTSVLKKMIEETFDRRYVTLIDGGHEVADRCLKLKFDKIFYTGSPAVARHVMAESAENLTPLALELGGETGNWCIVRKDANLQDAARKIAFFKLMNAGQICININQIAVAEEVAPEFIEKLKGEIIRQAGENPQENEEYSRLISESVYEKCVQITRENQNRIVFGGSGNKDTLKFSPTLIYPVQKEEELVQHELFSPILPIVPFQDKNVQDIVDTIQSREHPLALYLFTKDRKWAKRIMQTLPYGGGCINEVCVHMMVKGVPFNGVGHSGMGAYHGKWGFAEFTHPTTVLMGSTHFNLPLREHPYSGKIGKIKMAILKKFEV